jgi:4-amino-4-deoxy-L-arabinose transferase-like glycosyltransferase
LTKRLVGTEPLVNPIPFKRQQKLILIGLTALAFFLRLYQLDRESLWFDEALSTWFAIQPLDLSIHSMLEEGLHHSPLFYILLRPFAGGDFSEFAVRLLPVLLGVLAVPLLAQLGRLVASPRVGMIAALLLVINPFHLWYSRETRMYSLLFLIAAGAMYFFGRNVLHRSRLQNWLGLAFFTAVGINTHHSAFFVSLVQFIYILATFKRNHILLAMWTAAQVLAGLSFVPWLLVVLVWGKFYGSSAAPNYRPTVFDFAATMWNFSIGYTKEVTVSAIVVLGVFFITLLAGLRHWTQAKLMLLIWLLVPPVMAFGISFRLGLYVDRYLMVAFPAFLLLIALGIESIDHRFLRLAVSALIIGGMLGGLGRLYFDRTVYDRADWRGVAAYLEENVDPAMDTIATLYYQDLASLYFYYHLESPIQPVISSGAVDLPELPTDHTRRRMFFVLAHPNCSVHLVGHCQPFDLDKLTSDVAIKEWYAENRDRMVEVNEFTCIRVEVYE